MGWVTTFPPIGKTLPDSPWKPILRRQCFPNDPQEQALLFPFTSSSPFPTLKTESYPSPLKRRRPSAEQTPAQDIYQTVTDRLIAAMEKGEEKWQMPWHRTGTDTTRPRNVATRNPYHGINVPLLWATASEKGYQSGYWGSYKQWQQVGGQVRRGEKASPVVFWKMIEKTLDDPATGEMKTKTFPIAKPWSVFNAEQQDGWSEPEPPQPQNPAEVIEHVRQFIANTLAEIRYGGERAYFSPAGDYIQMPPMERFLGTETSTPTEAFYSTSLHELCHWSGGPKRLNRDFSGRFGSEAYSFEELIAEWGSAFLCSDLHISDVPRDDHARYLRSWLKVLRDDKKAIFTAASQATKAAEFLHSLQPDSSPEGEHEDPEEA